MAEVVGLDNSIILDNYQKILDEKKLSSENTISSLRTIARRRITDGSSIKSLFDLKGLFKDLSPLRYTYPDIYEQEKTILLPLICMCLNLKDTQQSRNDILIAISGIEKTVAEEVGPMLGIDEREATMVEQFRKRYVLDYTNARVIDLDSNGEHTNLDGFKLLHGDKRIHEGKKDIGIPEYLLKYSLLKCIDGYTNDPQLPAPLVIKTHAMKTTYTYNNWKGFRTELTLAPILDSPDKHCSNILNHIREYSVSKNSVQADLCLDWMAHMVQKPWEKPGWAIVYRGGEGCGKDVIARFLGRMFHPSHWAELSDVEFKNHKETAWKKGKVIVNVTEFSGITEKNAPHIYPIIEADEARIREMYMQAYTSKDLARFILTTNKENVIPAKLDTRRFLIPDFNDVLAMNHEDDEETIRFKNNHFDKIYAELGGKDNSKPPGPGVIAFYQFLMARDLSKFDVKHPRLLTRAIDDLIEINKSSLDIVVEDVIYRGMIPDYNDLPIMQPIILNENTETIIEGSILNANYRILYNKILKEGGRAYPKDQRFCSHFIKALGLEWEMPNDDWRNRRQHYKIMKHNALHYVLPPLKELRNIYFKLHPRKKRPTE